jgi:3-hydroxyisobutyrate dehydrogenase-like beta-hydroxyacid dehydrogenase
MAANLLKAGFRVRVWNRTMERAAHLVAMGAEQAASPADTVAPGGIVLTMVANDQALRDVTLGDGGLAGRLGKGGIHISMSTISPSLSRSLANAHQAVGENYVAAPVFGKPDVAAAGMLFVCLSGPPHARARVRPVLDAIGQSVQEFGDEPEAAHAVKLAGNFMLGAAIEAMGEAFTLAEKNGVSRQAVYEFFTGSLFDCMAYRNYGGLIASEQYSPVGAVPSLIRKDFGLVLDLAHSSMTPMPLAELVFNRLTATVNRGRDDLDWTGFAREISEAAGLRRDDEAPGSDEKR